MPQRRQSPGEAPPHAVSAEDLVLPNIALMRYRSAPHDPWQLRL